MQKAKSVVIGMLLFFLAGCNAAPQPNSNPAPPEPRPATVPNAQAASQGKSPQPPSSSAISSPSRQTAPTTDAHPRLFFTDLESGPNTGGLDDLGAFITVYGEGFGASRGSSTVTIGGKQVGKYVLWGKDNAYARKMDMIVVQPGPTVTSGDIVVTVNGKASNPLPFTVRSGSIFLVNSGAANASDENTGTFAQPFKTLYRERDQLKPGDIIYIKGGTFNTADPRAPGWDCVLCLFPDNDANGTAAAPIAYIGYPGDPPVIGAPQPMRRGVYLDEVMAHYVIANLRFTHDGGMLELAGDGHRVIGNAFYDGIDSYVVGIAGNSAHYKIFGNLIRNNGERGEKMNGTGLYIQGFGKNQDLDVGWNQIQDQHGSRAIQVFGHLDNDWVDNLRIHDNLISGSELNNITLGGSDGGTDVLGTVYVYNNVIVGSADPGLRVNDPQGTVFIWNNVLYNNGSPGFAGSHAQLLIERSAAGKITLQNNILVAGARQTYIDVDSPAGAAAIKATHNLCYGAGECPDWVANRVSADPQFVDIANLDGCVKPGSPAIDAGTGAEITVDYLGISRPQARANDIGACEFSAP